MFFLIHVTPGGRAIFSPRAIICTNLVDDVYQTNIKTIEIVETF